MNLLTSESTRLGFIGIGNMGSRIARRLLGYKLMAYNLRREAAEALVKDGATAVINLMEKLARLDTPETRPEEQVHGSHQGST